VATQIFNVDLFNYESSPLDADTLVATLISSNRRSVQIALDEIRLQQNKAPVASLSERASKDVFSPWNVSEMRMSASGTESREPPKVSIKVAAAFS